MAQFEKAGTKFVALPDGRKLEYVTGGAEDGTPVLAFNVQFGSCFNYSGGESRVGKELGLKIIGISVPGAGLSDGYPLGMDRSVHDIAGDVRALLDKEGIRFFHVLGSSAGSVYAAAVAYAFPSEMVGNVLIVAPPVRAGIVPGIKEAPMVRVMKGISSAPFAGDCLAWIMGNCMKPKALMEAAPDPKYAMQQLLEMGKTDPEAKADLDMMLHAIAHGFVHTPGQSMYNLYPIIYENHDAWIPKLSDFVAQGHKFGISSAPDDGANPQAMHKWWHENIHGSTFIEFPALGWGHAHGSMPGAALRLMTFLKTGVDPGFEVKKE